MLAEHGTDSDVHYSQAAGNTAGDGGDDYAYSGGDNMVITVAFDADLFAWCIYCENYGRAAPAGPRLFRAPPHPCITFCHDDQAGAERDAQKLREYLAGIGSKRGPSKSKLRKEGAD